MQQICINIFSHKYTFSDTVEWKVYCLVNRHEVTGKRFNHHHYHHKVMQIAPVSLDSLSLSLSLARTLRPPVSIIHRSKQVLLTAFGVSIELMHVSKYLLVDQHWCVHTLKSIGERSSWVRPCFISNLLHVLYVLLGWIVRWEVSGHTATVL